MLYRDLKHEAIAECFRSDKARTASFLNELLSSILFSRDRPWIKNNSGGLFDVTMSSYDSAQICELVGLYILDSEVDERSSSSILRK